MFFTHSCFWISNLIGLLSHPKQATINLAASDLARCLNYAGMEALEWQGENPVIIPENTPVERTSSDGFMVIPKNQNLENGDTL